MCRKLFKSSNFHLKVVFLIVIASTFGLATILNFGLACFTKLAEPVQNSKLLAAMNDKLHKPQQHPKRTLSQLQTIMVSDNAIFWSLCSTYLDNICNDTNSQKRLWRQVPKKQHSWPWIVMEWRGAFHNSCPVQTLLG